MNRKLISLNLDDIPNVFHNLFDSVKIYDSSCSPEARVYLVDKDCGYYLKSAPKESLKLESDLTKYSYSKGLGTEVLEYISLDKDWMLTKKVVGEDCTHDMYLNNPKKLCDTTAELLLNLHNTEYKDCPIKNRTESYINTAKYNYLTGNYDKSAFPDSFGYSSAEEAWKVVEKHSHCLKNDVLIHGDYCLPNIMLDNWKFSKYIDLGNGGVGDRHIDVFWGIWSLQFNLKTNKFASRFIDAYGRKNIDIDMLKLVAACEVFG